MTDENLPDLLRESALYFDDEMSSVMRVAATEIEQLRARLAEAEDENSRRETAAREILSQLDREQNRREDAEAQLAQLAEARRDGERLDFLIEKEATVMFDDRVPTYVVDWEDEDGHIQEFRASDFRAAIDAARGEG